MESAPQTGPPPKVGPGAGTLHHSHPAPLAPCTTRTLHHSHRTAAGTLHHSHPAPLAPNRCWHPAPLAACTTRTLHHSHPASLAPNRCWHPSPQACSCRCLVSQNIRTHYWKKKGKIKKTDALVRLCQLSLLLARLLARGKRKVVAFGHLCLRRLDLGRQQGSRLGRRLSRLSKRSSCSGPWVWWVSWCRGFNQPPGAQPMPPPVAPHPGARARICPGEGLDMPWRGVRHALERG